MGAESTARKLGPEAESAPLPRPVPVHGGGTRPPGGRTGPTNARLAMVMFLGAETMFFTGLLGAYIVLKSASLSWPPPGLPALPIAVTWANTFALVLSCLTIWRANDAIRRHRPRGLVKWLTVTSLLGTLFLCVQGSEWARLVYHGLTVSSGVYGSTFYLLIGAHGLHVLGAVLWLLRVLFKAGRDRFSAGSAVEVDLAAMYWYYVGALWLVIFPMVYLT